MRGKQGSLQESNWSDRLSSILARDKPSNTKSCRQHGWGAPAGGRVQPLRWGGGHFSQGLSGALLSHTSSI